MSGWGESDGILRGGAAPEPEPSERSGTGALPDAQLLQRHVDGDPEAFGVLFGRHRDRLWAVALRTLGDPEEAADALQEAMISAFRRAGTFRGACAVTTWLHRIVVNACIDRVRREAARPTATGLDEQALDALALTHPGRGTGDNDRDFSLDVMAALRTLPYDQRAALVLVDMLGYPVAEAADVLEVPVGTLKSRCARGRARLVPHLAHLRGPAGQAVVPETVTPAIQPTGSSGHGARTDGNRMLPGTVSPAEEGGDSR